MAVDGATAEAVLLDVAAGRAPANYTPEMRQFRETIEAEWDAWRTKHPEATLYIPHELPDAGDLREAATASKDGKPRTSFAYTPTDNPADWKLPYLTADGTPDAAHLAAAAAALSSGGFRGQKADIPPAAMQSVKAKLRQAYRRLGKNGDDMPDTLRESRSTMPSYVVDLLAEEQMQPRYVIEAMLEERAGDSDDHFYGAWLGPRKGVLSFNGFAGKQGFSGTSKSEQARVTKMVRGDRASETRADYARGPERTLDEYRAAKAIDPNASFFKKPGEPSALKAMSFDELKDAFRKNTHESIRHEIGAEMASRMSQGQLADYERTIFAKYLRPAFREALKDDKHHFYGAYTGPRRVSARTAATIRRGNPYDSSDASDKDVKAYASAIQRAGPEGVRAVHAATSAKMAARRDAAQKVPAVGKKAYYYENGTWKSGTVVASRQADGYRSVTIRSDAHGLEVSMRSEFVAAKPYDIDTNALRRLRTATETRPAREGPSEQHMTDWANKRRGRFGEASDDDHHFYGAYRGPRRIPTRSSAGRIIKHGQNAGSLPPGTTPVGKAAYVKGFVKGSDDRSLDMAQERVPPAARQRFMRDMQRRPDEPVTVHGEKTTLAGLEKMLASPRLPTKKRAAILNWIAHVYGEGVVQGGSK